MCVKTSEARTALCRNTPLRYLEIMTSGSRSSFFLAGLACKHHLAQTQWAPCCGWLPPSFLVSLFTVRDFFGCHRPTRVSTHSHTGAGHSVLAPWLWHPATLALHSTHCLASHVQTNPCRAKRYLPGSTWRNIFDALLLLEFYLLLQRIQILSEWIALSQVLPSILAGHLCLYLKSPLLEARSRLWAGSKLRCVRSLTFRLGFCGLIPLPHSAIPAWAL